MTYCSKRQAAPWLQGVDNLLYEHHEPLPRLAAPRVGVQTVMGGLGSAVRRWDWRSFPPDPCRFWKFVAGCLQ